MYVLAALEWMENECHWISLTQLAMIRVDENWQAVDRFYSRFHPMDFTFHRWNHVACTGGTEEDFLTAPAYQTVMENLRAWLQKDDILCFWNSEALHLLRAQFRDSAPMGCILSKRVRRFVELPACDPYTLGAQLDLPTELLPHYAADDAELLRRIMEAVQFPQPIRDGVRPEASHSGAKKMLYIAHMDSNIIHKNGCPLLQMTGRVKGYNDLKKPVKKRYIPCTCLKKEFAQAKRERNAEQMERTGREFFFANGSKVFHKKTCPYILNANRVHGLACWAEGPRWGRRPCKLCSPQAPAKKVLPVPPKVQPAPAPVQKKTKKAASKSPEQKAIERQKRALEAWRSMEADATLSPEKRRDQQTLISPSFAFYAAKGYCSFHLRNCQKLVGLCEIKGFATYEDAAHSGYTPCKYCRPTSKHNLSVVLPLTSRKRKDDSMPLLHELCEKSGFSHTEKEASFVIETPVGIWKVLCDRIPYHLMHINLVKSPGCTQFHRQPRIFLSLQDAFTYIFYHDKKLCRSCGLAWKNEMEYLPEIVV